MQLDPAAEMAQKGDLSPLPGKAESHRSHVSLGLSSKDWNSDQD